MVQNIDLVMMPLCGKIGYQRGKLPFQIGSIINMTLLISLRMSNSVYRVKSMIDREV